MTTILKCKYCNDPLSGRVDKIFCDPYCKSAYQYQEKKKTPKSLFEKVDKQLKLNRKILKQYNKDGVTTVREEMLLREGFNPKYFTNYWKNEKDDVYLFCYEYGFLRKFDKRKKLYRFILVQWQAYMD
ncbi:hypothetical protein [Marivirga sp.]|uniref:hypothetical protein n=1 Tax=Marivirga sp. TaxID=2018662 RepID=UPI002D7FAA04|nr:hypothetical protein [Marivirga sp.]HET8859868.1 hypothetical protein [Marivirga sp.]